MVSKVLCRTGVPPIDCKVVRYINRCTAGYLRYLSTREPYEFDVSFVIDHDVFWFEIAIRYIVFVHMGKG